MSINDFTPLQFLYLIWQASNIVGWWILAIKYFQKRHKAKDWKIRVPLYISIAMVELAEIVFNKGDLTWNMSLWYPINTILIFYAFKDLFTLEHLEDEIQHYTTQNNGKI